MHIEEVNHTVLVHMTEKMGYKHSEVLSAVLCNRACHTLAVYYLLKKKLKRLSTEYRVSMTAANYGTATYLKVKCQDLSHAIKRNNLYVSAQYVFLKTHAVIK